MTTGIEAKEKSASNKRKERENAVESMSARPVLAHLTLEQERGNSVKRGKSSSGMETAKQDDVTKARIVTFGLLPAKFTTEAFVKKVTTVHFFLTLEEMKVQSQLKGAPDHGPTLECLFTR